jgi:xanthine dehydrogenase small subunit
METSTLRFIRRGHPVTLGNVPPERTLLEVLREDLGATGTKEGCGEGDCGACTVVIGEIEGDGIKYRAINSCIRLAHSVDGMALWTVEDIVAADGTLHPAQEAMVQCHGSQCGFCTPGFVMSLFGMYQKYIAPTAALTASPNLITRELAQEELSGNLCRCTGYRPIFDAAQRMAQLPAVKVDEKALARQLRQLNTVRTEPIPVRTQHTPVRAEPVEALASPSTLRQAQDRPESGRTGAGYLLPKSLPQLLSLRASHPQAQVVAGCTDVGLWVTKMHMTFDSILDVTQVKELQRIERYGNHIAIGAAATLTDAFDALVEERPQLKTFGQRFAGLPVRNSGTLGGNVANGSPIGDSMPLLIALGAYVVLMSVRGHREMPLEHFYTGYRKTVLAPDEVVAWIKVPRPVAGEFLRAYKISRRYEDDISAVCLVVNLTLEAGRVAKIGIGAGGVAATPVRAIQTESFLIGKQWTEQVALDAVNVLRAEFEPISDMRASAAYRSEVLGNLVKRFWLESQGVQNINLESRAQAGEAA